MQTRLSASTRFILAVLRLSADIADGFGKAVIDILRKQYPEMINEMAEDPQYAENPAASIGHKLVAIARKQLQYNEQDAYDAIQDFLVYVMSSKFDFRAETKKGKPGASTWRQALNNIYANLRARAMSHSFKKFKSGKHTDEERYADMLWRRNQVIQGNPRYTWSDEDDGDLEKLGRQLLTKKVDLKSIVPTKLRRKNVRDKSLDEAFGKRGEEGGAAEGGLLRMPQSAKPEDTMGMPIDEMAAKKSFLESLDRLVPDMRRNLPLTTEKLPAQRFLFDFIFEEDGSGTFMPDVKANMGQASAFRDYLEEISMRQGPNAQEAKAILDRYGKRWSGFVGDTRLRLMKSIQDFIEEYSTEEEYEQLWKEFFSDVTPRSVEKLKEGKESEVMKYQRGLDLRKILRMEERDKLGMLKPKDKADLTKLRKKVTEEINDEVVEKTKQANAKHQKDLEKFSKERDAYLTNMMRVEHLPPEKQPRFKRPVKPIKPDPAQIRAMIPSLDEQLKATMAEHGADIQRGAEAELEAELHREEKQKQESELAESIAEEANAEVNARHGVSTFFRRFLPNWV
jgi:hypothetical protein